ncbi:MAG: deoxyribose-phosphate aldolase [Planctomycetota bacterium]|jgi:deoxyribose-phosphate aldolase
MADAASDLQKEARDLLGADAARKLASLIDHTLLKPDAARADIERLCDEGKKHRFASICVNQTWVPFVAERLRGSGVRICSVAGFPLGASEPEVKTYEARRLREFGADEVDMVMNVGALRSGDERLVRRDIRGVVRAAGSRLLVKVILETCLLTDAEKERACVLAKEAGAQFVKTSTGFGPGGATVEDVRLMRRVVGPEMGVKASGGIRDIDMALGMVRAGASRIGTSSGTAIVAALGA